MTSSDYMKKCLLLDRSLDGYSDLAVKLADYPQKMRLLHASIGMSGEAGEVLDSVKKTVMYGKSINKESLLEECGDLLWYMSVMVNELGSSFEEVMDMNVSKLQKRFPHGYNNADAIARKDEKATS